MPSTSSTSRSRATTPTRAPRPPLPSDDDDVLEPGSSGVERGSSGVERGSSVVERGSSVVERGRDHLTLIAAYADNRVIGDRGAIPWRIPADFAHFKATTLGGTL